MYQVAIFIYILPTSYIPIYYLGRYLGRLLYLRRWGLPSPDLVSPSYGSLGMVQVIERQVDIGIPDRCLSPSLGI